MAPTAAVEAQLCFQKPSLLLKPLPVHYSIPQVPALPLGTEGLYPQAAGAGVAVRKQYDSQFREWGSRCPPILTTGLQREG